MNVRVISFSASSPARGGVTIFYFSHSDGCVVISHNLYDGINFHKMQKEPQIHYVCSHSAKVRNLGSLIVEYYNVGYEAKSWD